MFGKMKTDLNSLAVYAHVAGELSFSEAARKLGLPVSTVSRKVADLEHALGVQLIERTTRKLRLTDIGQEVLREARHCTEVGEAVDAIVSNRLAGVEGRIGLSVPPSIADSLVAPIVAAFQSTYPLVAIHVMVTDRFVDHIAEGIDLAFRVGALKDTSLVAKPLLTYRRQLVASPEYIADNQELKGPSDLVNYRVLAFRSSLAEHRWAFFRGDEVTKIKVDPILAMNDYAGLAEVLVRGGGVGDLPPVVRPSLITSGKLVELIPDWKLEAETLFMLRLGNRLVSKPLRMFMDFASTRAKQMFPSLPK